MTRAAFSTLHLLPRPIRWALIGAALTLTSCKPAGVLDPQGPIASAEWLLLFDSTAIMLVVVIPVIVGTLAVAWWYRSSNAHASRDTDESYEGRVEFVVWSIPALTVILLGGVIWIGSHQLDPRAPLSGKSDAVHVDVVALDWKWLFIYPDLRVASVNQLTIPAGIPIEFQLTSATVMNSFFVPQLGSQIYAMGGMTTHLNLMADQPGEYPGLSANFSGDGFAWMRFIVKSVPTGDFNRWVEHAQAASAPLDDSSYAELAKPSKNVAPMTYRLAEPKLFDHIVDQTASGPGHPAVGGAWCPPTPQSGG
jgi:cytochrome o ubiquinol oxidase subunit II